MIRKKTFWLIPARVLLAAAAFTFSQDMGARAATADQPAQEIRSIDPPEKGFFSKRLDYEGIAIKAHKDVSDKALFEGRGRLAMMLENLPEVRRRLQKAGAELHIIGRNQVTSDLPEFRNMKGKPFDGKQTIDERTRGMGGLLASCGEENLLRLEKDRYRGRDICVHEFAHNIFDHGIPEAVRARFRQQRERSLAAGLWNSCYAGSNEDEFFAELSMWYWGTHGDLHMKGKKPANGRDGLRAYDPEAFTLFDEFYCGLLDAKIGQNVAAKTDEARLDNGLIAARFVEDRLGRLEDLVSNQSIQFTGGVCAITIDGERLSVPGLKLLDRRAEKTRLTSTYEAGKRRLQVIHELRPGWRFLSRQLVLTLPEGSKGRVENVEMFQGDLQEPVASEHRMDGGRRGVFLRLAAHTAPPTASIFCALQNPFMDVRREGKTLSIAYKPELEWKAEYGPLASDRACIGMIPLSGVQLPAHVVPEWKYVREPHKAFERGPHLDLAEVQALANCVRAFILAPPKQSLRVHVGWCENDYQIDVGTPEGRKEYRRIIDQAAAVGCGHVLFAPANREVSRLEDNADAWGWENILWLGLGQRIRRDQWNIENDPIPPSVQEMLDYAKSKNVRLVAYAYPTLGWKQDPEWTRWCEGKTGGYVGVDTGVRSFQDWFVDRLVAFHKRTGISGYSFDHWWIAYDKATSKYAQWYGCRRIMEELRRRVPDIVIDGRQQYQWFGPWTWLGGSYPHPTTNDEQAGSFVNFPDLHYDRVSANRQRFAAWYYGVSQCTPVDLIPGYMTHQTGRINDQGQCPRTRFRARDWDVLGWRYSVISSIGTAPLMHTLSMLPARDEDEFRAFSAADQSWLRGWLDWTDRNVEILRHLRPILGPPTLGRIDGTAAVLGDRGFVFLFNPNYRALDAEFKLDASIGLTDGKEFALKELYPRAGRWINKPGGAWAMGDAVKLRIKGPEALVLEIVPGAKAGPDGLPAAGAKPGGPTLEHCPQLGQYDPNFKGGEFRAKHVVPSRVFEQLKARRKAWPVSYTDDELRAAYLGSDRLLLYVHIAEPKDTMKLELKIDGQPAELKKAYSGVSADARERTFVGFYADISHIKPDVQHEFQVMLPELQPGQFQGLFLENVERD